MRSSSERINIAARTRRLDVDNRISLRYYHRIADNILKQADIFRAEKNLIDLYVMLLRFSSLVSETIPCHQNYGASPQSQKTYLKKRLIITLRELEDLKPAVQQRVDELNTKQVYQANGWGNCPQNGSQEWRSLRKQSSSCNDIAKVSGLVVRDVSHGGSRSQQLSYSKPVEEQFRKLSLAIPRPKEETLSRHSFLGPNGLHGQWHPPIVDKGVQYPSIVDSSPIGIPSLRHSIDNEHVIEKDHGNSGHKVLDLESLLTPNDDCQTQDVIEKDHENSGHKVLDLESLLTPSDDGQKPDVEEPSSLISFEATENLAPTEIIRQLSPPPVLAEVQDLIPAVSSQVTHVESAVATPSPDGFVHVEASLQLHISTTMMESFMKLAKSNTDKNLETCGVLAGSLKNKIFYVSTLIIPKQESTSNTCQTTNEEEIFELQDKRSLFPLGWIHTHPSQSCFMSSVDLHTHYSYQIMLPESVAIVMAPKDSSRKHGIFRLTTPGGMSVIRQCQQRGFHPHSQPPDGGPIYQTCTDVYMDPTLRFDVVDLR